MTKPSTTAVACATWRRSGHWTRCSSAHDARRKAAKRPRRPGGAASPARSAVRRRGVRVPARRRGLPLGSGSGTSTSSSSAASSSSSSASSSTRRRARPRRPRRRLGVDDVVRGLALVAVGVGRGSGPRSSAVAVARPRSARHRTRRPRRRRARARRGRSRDAARTRRRPGVLGGAARLALLGSLSVSGHDATLRASGSPGGSCATGTTCSTCAA